METLSAPPPPNGKIPTSKGFKENWIELLYCVLIYILIIQNGEFRKSKAKTTRLRFI